MKSISGVLPWVVIMTACGGAIWWMLARDVTAGRWLFGAILLGHGLVHLMYAVPESETGSDWPFAMDRSWVTSGINLSPGMARTIGWLLIAVTIVGLAIAAAATAGIAIPAGWWQPLVVVGAAASLLALVLFFDPQLVLGLGINIALIWVAVSGVWVPS